MQRPVTPRSSPSACRAGHQVERLEAALGATVGGSVWNNVLDRRSSHRRSAPKAGGRELLAEKGGSVTTLQVVAIALATATLVVLKRRGRRRAVEE